MDRRPLVLRGARQTGKTTIIRAFAQQFESFVELNLEKDAHQKIFLKVQDIASILRGIEGIANQRIIPGKTLLFLDEIQNSVSAIQLLRYFYEEMPGLHVIAAGSLLEVRMRREGWSFPVGRVEFLYLYPATFEEFLGAMGETILLNTIQSMRIKDTIHSSLHEKLLDLFLDYLVVGGMPAAVKTWCESKSFKAVGDYHEVLDASFREDFVKYSHGAEVDFMKRVWESLPFEMGSRITYSRIAGTNAKSREVSRAFDILHDAMLVERIYPTTQTRLPLVKKEKAAPKVLFLDVGLGTCALKVTRDQVRSKTMSPAYEGGLIEAFVGQEFFALGVHNRSPLFFWVRQEKTSNAEIDYLFHWQDQIIPVEVKSGNQGTLKSLHQFLYRSGMQAGVRISHLPPSRELHSVTLPTGELLRYELLSLPFYLTSQLPRLWKD